MQKCQIDIKNNKVKQGIITKQSRHLKQWRQRWLVLTKTHLYTFTQKDAYKNPTEIISLSTIINIKAYYKIGHFQKPNVFRIQTPDIHFYISTLKSYQKWSWMTAIQKMLMNILLPEYQSENLSIIRQNLILPNTIEKLVSKESSNHDSELSTKISTNNQTKKTNLNIFSNQINEKLQYLIKQTPYLKTKIKGQSSIQKVVEVPVEKIIYKQKIVYVPQIRQKIAEKIVEKIIYDSKKGRNFLTVLFEDIISSKHLNPKPMIDFVIFIITSKIEKYHSSMIQFCLCQQNQRFLSEIFLIMLNQQKDSLKIHKYIQFLTIIYQNTDQYLYSSDIKVLIDIILRQMQLNRSQQNQFQLLKLLKKLCEKTWWKKDSHRTNQLKTLLKELKSICRPQNQIISKQLLSIL